MKREFYFLSKDEKTQIHAIEWVPTGKVKAVLQMCHGMVEYIDRYHDFAEYLSQKGYYVVGHDHLGHGKSVYSSDRLGFFHETSGNECVIGDIHQIRIRTEEKYPNVPYFMLGHSMGSFLVRQYIGFYGAGITGAIIMGTGDQPNAILNMGKMVCRVQALIHGWKYRSALVDGMAAGGYNKRFEKETDGSNWLSRNPENVKNYRNDLLCGYMFTVNAYYHMFSGMIAMNNQEKAGRIPKGLSVAFVAGKNDPVGDFGKGVKKVYKRYKEMGMQDVKMRLYEDDRHEILQELDRGQVFEDLLLWLEKRI
jgi:alpha-beta hydrolase superfamily lysophospholipase